MTFSQIEEIIHGFVPALVGKVVCRCGVVHPRGEMHICVDRPGDGLNLLGEPECD